MNLKINKRIKNKIIMLTAYDYPMGVLLDQAGVDIVLVGDSLANVVLGLPSTRDVTMDEMIHHTKAVRRGVKNALLVGDMPYCAYQANPKDAVKNAQRFIKEAGCDAIKLEWFDQCLEVAKKIRQAGIKVMGHVGLTPQTADQLGGLKVQGKDAISAQKIIDHARDLEKIGCFSVVLECVPTEVAKIITDKLSIPTIGIGAGKFCDGQVLVINDLIGISGSFNPRFVKKYANLSGNILSGVQSFIKEVKAGKFPDKQHSYTIDPQELRQLK